LPEGKELVQPAIRIVIKKGNIAIGERQPVYQTEDALLRV
jgi:hypothetical protein